MSAVVGGPQSPKGFQTRLIQAAALAFLCAVLYGATRAVPTSDSRVATIAVTSNRLLDYFGRTVNIAARVQSASRSGEVLATEAVLSDPAVSEWRAREGVQATARTIALKGITDAMPVISLAHAGSGRPGSPSR
jgi:class 3 adenylate cyclase